MNELQRHSDEHIDAAVFRLMTLKVCIMNTCIILWVLWAYPDANTSFYLLLLLWMQYNRVYLNSGVAVFTEVKALNTTSTSVFLWDEVWRLCVSALPWVYEVPLNAASDPLIWVQIYLSVSWLGPGSVLWLKHTSSLGFFPRSPWTSVT